MTRPKRTLGPAIVGLLLITSVAPFVGVAQASTGDCDADVRDWIRQAHPLTSEARASEILALHLSERTQTPSTVDDVTNGLDAYVHDFDCTVSGGPTFCVEEIDAERVDGDDSFPVLGDANELLEVPGRTNNWAVTFFEAQTLDQMTTVSGESTDAETDDSPDSGSANEVCGTVPDGARYAVIYLTANQTDPQEPLNGAENMIPKGYHTKDNPWDWGTYTVQFDFRVPGI